VTASGVRELAVDRGENDSDFISEPDQNRDRDDGNKGQDQGVLDEGLAFLTPSLAAYFFMIHDTILSFSELMSARHRMKIVWGEALHILSDSVGDLIAANRYNCRVVLASSERAAS
jgi:hypothetical protein